MSDVIQILGPAMPDDSEPVKFDGDFALESELVKVHHIDEQGVWMQFRTGPGQYSEPRLPEVIEEEQLDGVVLQKLSLKKATPPSDNPYPPKS